MSRRLVVLAAGALVIVAPLVSRAHSDGPRCDEDNGPLISLALDGPAGEYVHCHDSGNLDTDDYWYTGAVYVHVPGAAHAGICTDTDRPLPPGFRLSPFFGTGDPSRASMEAQGCDPASNIQVIDNQFDPMAVTLPQGTTVQWKNDGPSLHASTRDTRPVTWDSPDLRIGQTFEFTLTQAGTYGYRCRLVEGMTGRIKIALAVSPSSGTRSTTFTIGLATHRATRGTVYDVEVSKDGGDWGEYLSGVHARTVAFEAGDGGAGTYAFRSRVRTIADGAATDWSPPRSIVVS